MRTLWIKDGIPPPRLVAKRAPPRGKGCLEGQALTDGGQHVLTDGGMLRSLPLNVAPHAGLLIAHNVLTFHGGFDGRVEIGAAHRLSVSRPAVVVLSAINEL